MFRFSSLLLLAAYAVDVVVTAQGTSTPVPICQGYMWGVTIQPLVNAPIPVYNQYVSTTACAGPAWVQSSTLPDPPTSIKPWGVIYLCDVPEKTYYCGETPVATCCGKLNTTTSS